MRTELDKKIERYLQAKDAYYNGNPIMADNQFDALELEIEEEWSDCPALSQVGAPVRGNNSVTHRVPMLSMNKALDLKALVNWRQSHPHELLATAKLDGISCELTFDNGVLTKAATRGNGKEGSDVTARVRYVSIGNPSGFTGAIRGEMVLTRTSFSYLNDYLVQRDEEPMSNPRNGVAGLFNEQAVSKDKMGFVKFFAYSIIKEDMHFPGYLKTQSADLTKLQAWGFKVPWNLVVSVEDYTSEIEKKFLDFRSEYEVEIDGIVLRVNDNDLAHSYGYATKYPKGAVAWKFPANVVTVTVKSIEWSAGSKDITPVVIFDSVLLDGANISRASGHSLKNLLDLEAAPGCEVKLIRSGGVIPKLEYLEEGKRTEDPRAELRWLVPDICPACKSELELSADGCHLSCKNTGCPAKLNRKLEIAAKALGMKYFGPAVCSTLVNSGAIESLADLLKIDKEFAIGAGVSEGIAAHLEEEVNSHKEATTSQVLRALSIHRVGQGTAEKVAKVATTPEDFLNLGAQAMATMVDISDQRLIADMQDSIIGARSILIEWRKLGLKTVERFHFGTNQNSDENSKNFVITGPLSKPRGWYAEKLKQLGHILQTSVGKSTDYLVTNNQSTGTSKMKKAKAFGTQIISENELRSLINLDNIVLEEETKLDEVPTL